MLYKDFTEKILGMQDVEIENLEDKEAKIEIHCGIKRRKNKCPSCGKETDKVHDYRIQELKDAPIFGKMLKIYLKKRRYRCSCGKRFDEKNKVIERYQRITKRLTEYIVEKLREERSFTSVAKEVGISVSSVIRVFDVVSYSKPKLPEALSIDEFKGNTGGDKYQCIIADPVNKIVLDILPKRQEHYLSEYFYSFSKDARENVKFFVSDMWKPFSDTASSWLKNAIKVVDKYHWMRQILWAFDAVRREQQKKFSKTHRLYFKNSRRLLFKRFDFLSNEQKQQVNIMLYASPTLSSAYFFKERFLKILDSKDISSAKRAMSEWINDAIDSDIPQIQKCAKTMHNWFSGILNSFSVPITNGFVEGCNNKIKVLKRNAYGYRNFKRFRNRILHIFSHQRPF